MIENAQHVDLPLSIPANVHVSQNVHCPLSEKNDTRPTLSVSDDVVTTILSAETVSAEKDDVYS
jgi:hypothetical protein